MVDKAVTKTFQDFAQKPETYKLDIDCYVVDFYRDYPDQKGKLFFVDADHKELILLNDTNKDKIKDKPDIIRIPINNGMEQAISKEGLIYNGLPYEPLMRKTIYVQTEKISHFYIMVDIGYVVFSTNMDRPGLPRLLGSVSATEMEKVFTMDHETAHIMRRCDSKSRNLWECIADANATIKHIQRFGSDSSCIKNIVGMRAVELVFRADGGEHFTSPVTEKIIADSKTVDFSTLTPKETKLVASRYALKYMINSYLVEKMFDKFKGKLPEIAQGNHTALRLLGNHVLSTDSAAEFKWGAVAFRNLMDGNVFCDGVRILPVGDEWQKMREAIDHRQVEYEARNPVFFGLAPQIHVKTHKNDLFRRRDSLNDG